MRPIPIFASASEIALDAHTYFYRHPDVKTYLESFEVRLLAPRFAELAREFVASYFGWLKENRRIVTRFDKLAKATQP
jgi:hypothetical protein